MNTLIRMVGMLVVVNLFMYIGVNFAMSVDGDGLNENYNFHFEGDLVDQMLGGYTNLDTVSQDLKENWTSYGVNLNENFSAIPNQESGQLTGSSGFNGLDALKIVWGFVLLLGNIVVSPLTLFFNFQIPALVGIMIGIPYFTIMLMAIIAMIRGVGD